MTLRRLVPLGATLALTLLAGASPAAAETTGDVLVQFKPGTSAGTRAAARAEAGGRLVEVLPASGVQVLAPRAGRSARAAIAALDARRDVTFAEPDRIRRAQALPAETRYNEQWGLAEVGAPAAWDTTFGNPAVPVAILDTGVSDESPDLSANLRPGQDFVGVGDADPDDEDGHGTRVAGVVAARDDGLGLVGLAPRTAVLPVRVLSADGTGSDADIAEGIDWAVANGAKVLNLSLSGPGWGETLHQAILRAGAQGALVVTSAGNGAADNDASRDTSYPCNDDAQNLICVAGATPDDQLAPTSSYGAVNVDLAAPGVSILTTDWYAPRPERRYAEDFETPIGSRWAPSAGAADTTWQQLGGDYVATANARTAFPGSEAFANAFLDLRRAASCTLALDVTRALSATSRLRVRLTTQDGSLQRPTEYAGVVDAGPARLTLPAGEFIGRRDVRLTVRLIADAASGDSVRIHGVTLDCPAGPLAHSDTLLVDGTSYAAPFVSGAAALVLGAGRADGAAALRARLLGSVDVLPALAGRVATGGRLNAAAAVGPPSGPPPTPGPGPGSGSTPFAAPAPARPGPPPPPSASATPAPGAPAVAQLRAPARLSLATLRRGLPVKVRLTGRGRLELWTAGRGATRLARQSLRGDGRTRTVRLKVAKATLQRLARRRALRLEVRLHAGSRGPALRAPVRVTR